MSGTPLKCQKRWGFRGLRPLTPTKGLCPLDPRRGHRPRTPPQIKMKRRPCQGPYPHPLSRWVPPGQWIRRGSEVPSRPTVIGLSIYLYLPLLHVEVSFQIEAHLAYYTYLGNRNPGSSYKLRKNVCWQINTWKILFFLILYCQNLLCLISNWNSSRIFLNTFFTYFVFTLYFQCTRKCKPAIIYRFIDWIVQVRGYWTIYTCV